MPLADSAAFWPSLGWLAALMFAALLPSLPRTPWRPHAGWLIAFCAACLLIEAQDLVAALPPTGRVIAMAAAGLLLWEFARRSWNDRAARRLGAATHLVVAEGLALIVAALAATDAGARPAWFAAAEWMFAALPLLLGLASAALLWRPAATAGPGISRRVRLALIGVGLYGLGAGVLLPAAASIGPPVLLAAGLGLICLREPSIRTRAAVLCAGGSLVTATVGPLIVGADLRRRGEAQRADLLTRAERAVAPLQGRLAERLGAATLASETRRTVAQHLERVAAADPLLRTATIWRLHGERAAVLAFTGGDAAEFVERAASTEEKEAARTFRPFVEPPRAGAPRRWAIVHAPLTPAMFESPTAWLSLAYPEVFWESQRQHARRTGVVLVGVFAGFCAMGFVLAARHALEEAQRVVIEREQSASKAKTEFLAFLSHEMRTPLQTILGRAELLRAAPDAGDAARRHADAIETQGRLLLRLVTDLLDLGTLEAGKFQLHAQPFSLRRALTAVEDTTRGPAAAKQLGLAVDVAAGVPDALVGDEARLRQILGNLLGNAVKYTTRGHVRLSVELEPGEASAAGAARLAFRVSDTGPGLPPDKIPQLFTLFTRLDSGDTFTREGTGVGLALVRRLCDLMGGTVAAANRAEGGAEFTVRLAFPRVASPVATGSAAETRAGGEGLDVLVAEDNAAAREFLVEALRALGHRAEAAADGDAALAMAGERRFDAVLLDVNLPGRDGISLARALAARPTRPRLIGCSAEAFAHTRAAALAAGMDAFLEKPVSVAALAAALGDPRTAAAGDDLFARLQHAGVAPRARALLAAEWPARHAAATRALEAHDAEALRALAHYVQSSALLAGDAELLALCRRLAAAAANEARGECRATLDALDQLVGGFAPPR